MDPYKARKMAKWVAVIIIFTMIVTSFSFVFFLPSMFGSENYTAYGTSNTTQDLDSYIKFIKDNYKDEVTTEQLVSGSYEGIVNSLNDPYSVFYSTGEEGEAFIEQVSGEFSGIGVTLESYDGMCRVTGTIPGSPAEKEGVKAGDTIIKVAGKNVESMSLEEIVALLKGEIGTAVEIVVERAGSSNLTFKLVRAKISTASVFSEMQEDKIGYIAISGFDSDTQIEFANARMSLINKGAKSLIIDIRNNPGGFINGAIDIANQLMPKGPIVHTMQKGKIIETIEAKGTEYALPTVLLINERSASASELLAGALQDSKTATLVGTTTFGKGIMQQVMPIDENSSLKLSTHYFLTPNKNKIDKVGITPDYTVANTVNLNQEDFLEYLKFAPMKEATKPKKGDTGLNVFGAQQRLELLGYDVSVTGTMDAKTVAAVNQFQKAAGFKPYGVLDNTTKAALEKEVQEMIVGVKNAEDLQLKKAIELLK